MVVSLKSEWIGHKITHAPAALILAVTAGNDHSIIAEQLMHHLAAGATWCMCFLAGRVNQQLANAAGFCSIGNRLGERIALGADRQPV